MDRDALGGRTVLDICYFIIVLVVLLNIIFGIIIDTFSDLRMQKMEREDRINNYCTICDLTKLDIDRAADTPGGFRRHIKQEHHMWNYLKFMIFLQNQDQDDDDGLELYVRQCIERKDVSWFPMGQAMCMLQDEDSTDKKENTVDTTDSGRRGGVSSTDNESLSEMKLLIEEMKKGMEDKMEKIEKQIAGINSAGTSCVSTHSIIWLRHNHPCEPTTKTPIYMHDRRRPHSPNLQPSPIG